MRTLHSKQLYLVQFGSSIQHSANKRMFGLVPLALQVEKVFLRSGDKLTINIHNTAVLIAQDAHVNMAQNLLS